MVGDAVQILLVEDDEVDEVDAEAIQRAFRKRKIASPITVAKNGLEALKRLRGEGVDSLPRPFIILLDLNMPCMNGIEFLTELRSDKSLADSVVFVLTTSNADRDKTLAYRRHISGYVVKSRVGDDFGRLVEMVHPDSLFLSACT